MLFYFGKFSTLKKQGILILLLWKISNNIFRFNILSQLSVVYWYFDSTLQLVCTINFNDVLFILKKLLFPPETFCLRAIMKHTHTCGNQDITLGLLSELTDPHLSSPFTIQLPYGDRSCRSTKLSSNGAGHSESARAHDRHYRVSLRSGGNSV